MSGEADFEVVVKVGELESTNAKIYSFLSPKISEIRPGAGVKSGGTLVTIIGTHLDIGAERNVDIDGLECFMGCPKCQFSANQITCVSQPSTEIGSKKVTMRIDACKRTGNFEVYADPEIIDVTLNLETPKWLGENPQSIPAFLCGGSSIILKFKNNQGNLFGESHRPRIYFNETDTVTLCEKRDDCKVWDQKFLKILLDYAAVFYCHYLSQSS